MKIFAIGFGQAGGKLVDLFVEFDKRTRQNCIVRALAINTAKADLLGLKHIPMEDRLLIGQSRVKGHGVGADNELGAKVAAEDIYSIQNAIDKRGTHQTDAFFIIAGLGGGTGSGGAPVLARRLKKLYMEPVYGLGILPSRDEGGLYSLNAARSFMSFVKEVDNLFLFDNDAWKREGESLKDAYALMNEEIVRRFSILFGAGESNEVGQMVVDVSEITNTLKGGGVSTVGYAMEPVVGKKKGIFGRFKKEKQSMDTLDTTARILSLMRRAVMGRLTIQCDISTAEKALIVMAGPPDELNRKGMEKAKLWLEDLIKGAEVRGGDYPVPKSNKVAAVAVFSGVTDVPRIKELQKMALEAHETIKEVESKKDEKFEELLDTDESLKPLI
ncbi:MAG: tubulin/FtsZ family protein [Candidatus Syntropharchaeia archaeon]